MGVRVVTTNVLCSDRIFAADAKRTFSSEEFQQRLVKILEWLYRRFGDYHQVATVILCGLLV